jgi:hypothetical protein
VVLPLVVDFAAVAAIAPAVMLVVAVAAIEFVAVSVPATEVAAQVVEGLALAGISAAEVVRDVPPVAAPSSVLAG